MPHLSGYRIRSRQPDKNRPAKTL